jgi:uncharacterized protein YdaU (DUF1376 family)
MSLTWFKIPIAEFLKETRRLSLEAKGAYMTLLCDYYENGPFADCAIALANVAGVPSSRMADIWEELEPLFIRDMNEGEWHHLRADKEIADRSKASERAVTNGSKGGRKPASSIMETMRREVERRGEPLVIDEEAVRQMVAEDQKRAPKPLALVVDGETDGDDEPDLTSAPKVETTTQYIGKPPPAVAPAPPPDEEEDEEDEPFTLLPPDFKLEATEIAQCRADGATFEQIAAWFDEFKTKHLQTGTTAQDWKAAWEARFAGRLKAASRPSPRVEVSRKA